MFYKFIFFIKNLFSKKERKNEEVSDNKKALTNNINVNNINWDLINQINEYDIVWVRMNEDEIKKGKIREGHQSRPFLVTKKDNSQKEASGYYFSSNINSNYAIQNLHNSRLILDKDNYNLKKDSILLFNKIVNLPYENIDKILDSLSLNDLRKLNFYIRNLGIENKDALEKIDIKYLNVGKIITINDRYYLVYQKEKNDIYCFNIKKYDSNFNELNKEEKLNYFKYKNKYYRVNFDERLHINEDSLFDIKIIDRISTDDVDRVLKNRTQIKYNKKKIKRNKVKQKKKRR